MMKIKTILLLTGLSGLLLLLGSLIGGVGGMQIALVLAIAMNGFSYFFSDTIVLRLYQAQSLDPQRHEALYSMVRELIIPMNLPMPKLWLIDSPMANAFATGRNKDHASIAVTSGILTLLDRHELRGVLAHELAHIKNRDILVTTIAATIAAAIGYVAHMLQHATLWGAGARRKGGNPLALFLMAIIMPIAATILQLAVSRSREYLADETGAHYCQDPLALASALEKLHTYIPHAHLNADERHKASTASLFIVHPFAGDGVAALFSTHPPMHCRIARLQELHKIKEEFHHGK
jgi:heat shock protein HtpX